jgi:DNA-directed RNA polymerase subunit RPC12/RpoP
MTLGQSAGMAATAPDLHRLLRSVYIINAGLLIFNILPIYPLDGGQILRSLLWFVLGRARSLMVATILGLIGVAGFIVLAIWEQSIWYGAIAVFMLMNCWGGLQHARALLRFAKLPRREGFACPACKTAPPLGEFWTCGKCGQSFDIFQTGGVCPHCATRFAATKCLDCGAEHPMSEWSAAAFAPR